MYRPTHHASARTELRSGKRLTASLISCCLIFFLASFARAGSATWKRNARSGDWNTKTNWTPAHVPNASTDTATFALSNTTNVSISENTEVNGITFTAAAINPYTITASPGLTLTLSGTGITNNSGTTQNFVTAVPSSGAFSAIVFNNSATAGNMTVITNAGARFSGADGGETLFNSSSTAGSATINNNAGTAQESVGFTEFSGSSTAGSATINNNAGTVSGAFGGLTFFGETSTAGSATINNTGSAVNGQSASGTTVFFNTSTAGSATINNTFGGLTEFRGSGNGSTAGSATINNNAGTVSGALGGVTVLDGSAGSATINNAGSAVSGARGGVTDFFGTAANSTCINNGGMVSGADGGLTRFGFNSTADSATLIANGGTNGGLGGTIFFADNSTGGTSRVEVFGNGNLDISFVSFPHHSNIGVTVGSIEGDGNVFLGGKKLTVGSSDLSTAFSGVIQDGGQNGATGGSLTKIGTGTLELTGANTYTGNTNVNGGVLEVDGSITSNTLVNRLGTLAGTGNVYGAVKGPGTVSPGDAAPGTLTVNSYTQPLGSSTLLIDIAGTGTGQFSVLDVLGNVNANGYLDPVLLSGFIPSIGDEFTFLNYESLSGAFKLKHGGFFNNGMERWVVTYQATDAVLTATKKVPELGSTLLLFTLSLLGLVAYGRQLPSPLRCENSAIN